MGMNQSFIAELKHEAENTRKILQRVPKEHFDWKPHAKSMSLGRLAAHIAELTGWAAFTIETDGLDFATMDRKPFVPKATEELVQLFDENLQKSLEALKTATDEQLMKPWKLSNGPHVILDQPKAVVLRGMCFNHVVHHRAQLGVYLRLLNVAIPGMYGPTADEMEAMAMSN
jgi:uncharacterized damage-inducible protein DinB